MMKIVFLFLVLLVCTTEAFVSSSRVRGVVATSTPRRTCLFAAAPKKTAAKAKSTKKKSATKKKEEQVESFRKADFISSIKEKTGLSKIDSEAALQAVMETITEVRTLEIGGVLCFLLNMHALEGCTTHCKIYILYRRCQRESA
jgi:hypothetical protein